MRDILFWLIPLCENFLTEKAWEILIHFNNFFGKTSEHLSSCNPGDDDGTT